LENLFKLSLKAKPSISEVHACKTLEEFRTAIERGGKNSYDTPDKFKNFVVGKTFAMTVLDACIDSAKEQLLVKEMVQYATSSSDWASIFVKVY
jgi:hypothetical protein